MCKILTISVLFLLISCQSNKYKEKVYNFEDVVVKDSLVYQKERDVLFSGVIFERDSVGRVISKLNYDKGRKHGLEIQYEYFDADVAVVVLEGNWTKGRKSGTWKSYDGEGQITVIMEYD